eukprot:Opistho-1_new@6139
MLEKLQEIFRDVPFLGPVDLLQLLKIVKLKQVAKGEHIVREGDFSYKSIKVIKGLLCHYTIDEGGDERTLLFVPESKYSGSLQTIMNNKPADENILALEDSLLLLVDMRELEKLAAKNLQIMKLLNLSYKQIIQEAALRIKFLISYSAEERYLYFSETYPGLEQRVKQKDLASFLGVTVSSLSRMRARIAKH